MAERLFTISSPPLRRPGAQSLAFVFFRASTIRRIWIIEVIDEMISSLGMLLSLDDPLPLTPSPKREGRPDPDATCVLCLGSHFTCRRATRDKGCPTTTNSPDLV